LGYNTIIEIILSRLHLPQNTFFCEHILIITHQIFLLITTADRLLASKATFVGKQRIIGIVLYKQMPNKKNAFFLFIIP